MHGTIGIL